MKLNRFHKIILAALIAAHSFTAVAQTTNALAPSGYAKFIADRNIFNPTREPGRIGLPPRPRPTNVVPPAPRLPNSFSLVGIIGYGDGRLAGVHVFFDGSSLQYQKEAEMNGTIATFKVAGISADSVTLVSGTNAMVLEIGEQLHDDAGGHWFLANGTTPRYNDTGGNRYGNGRNSDSGGFGGRRRNNNGGNGNGNGGYNNGNNGYGNNNNGNGRNFNRGRNNYNNDSSAATPDDSQAQDENATPSGGMALPVLTPDGIVTPDGTLIPVQDNTTAPGNSDNPNDTTPQDNNQ